MPHTSHLTPGAVIPLQVTAEAARQLLAALAADGTSRVSRDRDARAAALCAEHVVAAVSAVALDADIERRDLEHGAPRAPRPRARGLSPAPPPRSPPRRAEFAAYCERVPRWL